MKEVVEIWLTPSNPYWEGKSANKIRTKRESYSPRKDVKKLESNWRKTLRLLKRGEFSMAIVQADTCADIAANILLRTEFVQEMQFEPTWVEKILSQADGLPNTLQVKFYRLIYPIVPGPRLAKYRRLMKPVAKLNNARNKIADSGRIAKEAEAVKLVLIAHELCTWLVKFYEPGFKLPKP